MPNTDFSTEPNQPAIKHVLGASYSIEEPVSQASDTLTKVKQSGRTRVVMIH